MKKRSKRVKADKISCLCTLLSIIGKKEEIIWWLILAPTHGRLIIFQMLSH
jgi:hypothetical protein